MGLLDKLQTQGGSNLSNLNGRTPSTPEFAQSKLHDTYSADAVSYTHLTLPTILLV